MRILILVVLFFIAFRLLTAGRRKKTIEAKKASASGPKEQFADVLEEDPVCHKLVPRQQAVQLRRQGKSYYFCSQTCCDTFSREQGERT